MPRPRFDRPDPGVQARILDAAGAELAAHGAERAPFNRIIAAGGIPEGAICCCFDDKEDLLATVLRRASTWPAAAVGGLDPAPDAPDADGAGVRGLLARMWPPSLEDPTRLAPRKGAAHVGLAQGRSAPMDAWMADLMTWTDGILAAGERAGAVRADVPRALLGHRIMGAGQALDLGTLRGLGDDPDAAALPRAVDRHVDTFGWLVAA